MSLRPTVRFCNLQLTSVDAGRHGNDAQVRQRKFSVHNMKRVKVGLRYACTGIHTQTHTHCLNHAHTRGHSGINALVAIVVLVLFVSVGWIVDTFRASLYIYVLWERISGFVYTCQMWPDLTRMLFTQHSWPEETHDLVYVTLCEQHVVYNRALWEEDDEDDGLHLGVIYLNKLTFILYVHIVGKQYSNSVNYCSL